MTDIFMYDRNSDSYSMPVIITAWDVDFITGDKLTSKMREHELLCRQFVNLRSDYQRLLNLSEQAAQPALDLLTEAIEKRDALWLEIGSSYDERQRKDDEQRRHEAELRDFCDQVKDTEASDRAAMRSL